MRKALLQCAAFGAVVVLSSPTWAQGSSDPPPADPNAAPAPAPLPAPAPAPAPEPAPSPAPEPAPATEPATYEAAPPPEATEYRAPSASDRVIAYYTGLQIGISPGIIFPTGGGSAGFLLSLYGGYGIEAGGLVVIPGIHATGAWPPDVFIGTVMPTGKVVFPLGAFAPYVEAGAGPGYVSADKKQTGVAVRVGGGFSVHPSARFAIGAGVAYETITGTNVAFLGPVLILSF